MAFYMLGGDRQKKPEKVTSKCGGCGGCKNGFVHSIESMGTLDGPGIRTVVFLSGCPMRCKYCHNVDVTVPQTGTRMTPEQLVTKILRNKSYFTSSGGGVTFSGGEPLFQACFLKKCLELCQKNEIHTAVDTSLFSRFQNLEKITPYTDLFLVSIKQLEDKDHQALTGVSNKIILENLEWLSTQKKPIWIRYVLIPGITNTPQYLDKLVLLIKQSGAEKIEILPYHKAGKDKWEKIGKRYEFDEIAIPTKEEIRLVASFFSTAGFEVLCNY